VKVVVTGVSGNGKTTLSRKLSEKLGIPYVELDSLCHLPGWREASNEDFRRDVEKAIAQESWVVDGSYERKIGNLVYAAADIIVWLDLPLPLVLARLTRRALYDIMTKRELFNGNTQSWKAAFFERDSLVAYAVKKHFRIQESYPRKFAELKGELVRLRSPREVEGWLKGIALRRP